MKILFPFLLLSYIIISCDKDVNCNSGIGERTVISGQGILIRHPGFDQLVIRYHLPGTIDSFHTYIPCNLSGNFTEGTEIQFEGSIQKLDEKDTPNILIAGEEFFVLFITEALEVQ